MIEVVVAGGGIAGSAVALALRERGAVVSLVDPGVPGGEATGASAGMLAPQYEAHGPGPLFRLLVAARAGYPAWVARVEALSGQRVPTRWEGMLVANLDGAQHAAAARTLDWQRRAGEAAELLDPADAARIEPGVTRDAVSYLWHPREGQVDSQALAAALGPALDAAGVRRVRGRVREVRARGGRVEGVALEDGRRLDADHVVMAAGAWSGGVAGLPRPLPVRPVRGQMLRFAAGSVRLRPLVGARGGRYVVPRPDGTVLAGSTMEEAGFDRSLEDAGLDRVHAAAKRLVPALGALRPAERWTGLRPLSADGLPVVGADPELRGLSYATGYGRVGILLAPLAGEAVAGAALGDAPGPEWTPFSIARWGAGARG